MSERKTIQINPDMFKMSNKRGTQKKEPKSPKIQLKSELKTQKQKTLRKNVLKMIREKQQEAYKELFNKKGTPSVSSNTKTEFDKDFDESLKFFSSLANKVQSETPINTTFKNYEPLPIIQQNVPSMNITQNPFSDNTFQDLAQSIQLPDIVQPPMYIQPQPQRVQQQQQQNPQYGCLKNGSLPTFRTFTRKNGGMNDNGYVNDVQPNLVSSEQSLFKNPILSPKFIEQSQKFDKIHQGNINRVENKQKQKIKYKKRKKIFKRTYKVGRSQTEPKIGVLVSNKTVRNRISTQAQLLKQTPIQEVRKFLIKKGFIKIGTNAPNDVLRKMYETVSLVCGEIQNHNPDNLLYNFINGQE